MKRGVLLSGILALGVAQACSITSDVFSDDPGGREGSGAAGGTTVTGGAPSTSMGSDSSSASDTTSDASNSSSAMSTAMSSSSGMMDLCEHDMCAAGEALTNGCNPCVQQVCAADPSCCDGMWDETCVGYVWSVCQTDCWPSQPDCEMQYGGQTGYTHMCYPGDGVCEFGATTWQTTCSQICLGAGGECLDAYNNQGLCGFDSDLNCQAFGFMDLVCVCSRGCGGGPACQQGQVCNNGQCVN